MTVNQNLLFCYIVRSRMHQISFSQISLFSLCESAVNVILVSLNFWEIGDVNFSIYISVQLSSRVLHPMSYGKYCQDNSCTLGQDNSEIPG